MITGRRRILDNHTVFQCILNRSNQCRLCLYDLIDAFSHIFVTQLIGKKIASPAAAGMAAFVIRFPVRLQVNNIKLLFFSVLNYLGYNKESYYEKEQAIDDKRQGKGFCSCIVSHMPLSLLFRRYCQTTHACRFKHIHNGDNLTVSRPFVRLQDNGGI